MRPVRSITLAVLVVVSACADTREEPPTPDVGMRMPPPEWAQGTWVVARHLIPGISAMTDAQAASWDGRTLMISDSAAVETDTRCALPSYSESLVPSDSIRWSFRLAPGTLPLREPASTVLDVLCHGAPWTAFGGSLIVIHPDTVLAPWDGVFFVLGRR